MDAIEKIFDELTLNEVICRLPGEMAVRSLNKRIKQPEDLPQLFEAAEIEKGTLKIKEVGDLVNNIVDRSNDIPGILDNVGEKYHPMLYGFLNSSNKERLLDEGQDNMTAKFLFNLSDRDNAEQMEKVIDRIVADGGEDVQKYAVSVLSKVSKSVFSQLADKCTRSSEPLVRSALLSVYNEENFNEVTETQKLVALKALAKIKRDTPNAKFMNKVSFKAFQTMKPLERLLALERYLGYFPAGRGEKPFTNEPTEDDLDEVVFAGCFDHLDIVENIKGQYRAITTKEKAEDE